MAFPVVESVTLTTFSTAGTAHLVAMPATVNAGDLLISQFSAVDIPTVATPTNWNLLHSTSNADVRLASYYKIAVGDEDGTTVDHVTSASVKAVAYVYRISAWHGTTPPEVGTAATGSGTAPNPPTLTPSWGAEDTLWLATVGWRGVIAVSVYSANYTNGTDDSTTAGPGSTIATARRELNATSDDPGAFTAGTANWIAQTYAIRPSAGAATQNLTGALFTKAPTFPQGAVTSSITLAGALFTKAPTFPLGTVTLGAAPAGSTVTVSGTTVTIVTAGTVTITGPGGVVYSGGSGTVVLPAGDYTWTSTDGSSGSFTVSAGGNRIGGSGAIRKPPRHVGR